MWGSRIVISPQGQKLVLQELHESHPVVRHMEALARMYVWWPGTDKIIETNVTSCYLCKVSRCKQELLHPWELLSKPWTRLHIDYAGPFTGKMFLVVVDATSKWLEVEMVTRADSQITIEVLRNIFATHCK